MTPRPQPSTLFPYTTLFRSQHGAVEASDALLAIERHSGVRPVELHKIRRQDPALGKDSDERTRIKEYRNAVESAAAGKDRKSTRLNSSHRCISYAVFCLKKK